MSVESAKQDVQVSFGKDFVIMGGDRVEVSPDGEKVTAYAKDDVEAKAASGVIPVQGGSFSADFNTVVLNGVTIVRAADGHLVISVPGGVVKQGAAPANDGLFVPPVASSDVSRLLRAKATLEIGAVESTGEHKGEIYGGIYPADKNPIWFSAAPKSMDHFNAASWATEQGGALPTRKQGDYLTTLKDKGGAFTELFNRGGSFPAGYVWLAEPDADYRDDAWCQRLGFGDQGVFHRNLELPVLSVRR
jgi:hypothetical protein